jgi:hypothetical protein
MFHRLLLNFTWWVNRKDLNGRNVFEGGFLGLDNIGVFDRSAPLPTGGHIEQADGTSWMAMFALNMMRMALELAKTNPVYQDLASKFFEHFLYIAYAMANAGELQLDLWDDQDEFYYDVLNGDDKKRTPLRIRSMVGLVPLFAVEVLEEEALKSAPQFVSRMNWFLENRPQLAAMVSRWQEPGKGQTHLLSLLRGHRMKKLLRRMLDEAEFLSEYGVRSMSRYHQQHPYIFEHADGANDRVDYEPGESSTSLFGGNSNWRGPIWSRCNASIITTAPISKWNTPPTRGSTARCWKSRRLSPPGSPSCFCAIPTATAQPSATTSSSSKTPTSATTCSFTSTSTATTAKASAPVTKPAGPASSPSCCNHGPGNEVIVFRCWFFVFRCSRAGCCP